jgi:hypothetical protein
MATKVKLQLERDGRRIREEDVTARKTLIGRGQSDGDDRIVLDDETVSFDHALVQLRGDDVLIQDLKSRNRVLINGQFINPGIFYRLRNGDTIEICAYTLRVNIQTPRKVPPQEKVPPTLGDFRLAVHFAPVSVTASDFTTYQTIAGGRVGVGIGSIEPKSPLTEETAVACGNLLRISAVEGKNPSETLEKLNALLLSDRPTENPISVVYGILVPGQGTFRFASAGELLPVFYNRGNTGTVRQVPSEGRALNVSEDPLGAADKLVRFRPGDVLLLPTGGILRSSFSPDHEETQNMRNLIREELIDAWGDKLAAFIDRLKTKIDEVEDRVGPFGFQGLRQAIVASGAQGLATLLPGISEAVKKHLRDQAPSLDQTVFGIEKTG